jgi:putative zinc finger/helix-turn-helix YgiT family protein
MEGMKIKPFPWMCPECRQKTIIPIRRDYAITSAHDGAEYNIVVKDYDVPTCPQCGSAIVISDLCERITDELRRAAGLLFPQEIRERREALGISSSELAAALRIPEATLIRWEEGGQLQSRAMDLLLRLFLDSAEVRKACFASSTNMGAVPSHA